jgi:hypothetical protein
MHGMVSLRSRFRSLWLWTEKAASLVQRFSAEKWAMRPRVSVKRLLYLAILAGIVFSSCILLYWLYFHLDDPQVVSFLSAWIPFVFSIVLAFVPDIGKRHMAWRISILGVGLIWSIVLWKQTVTSAELAKRDQDSSINRAVLRSNEHTDRKFSELKRDISDGSSQTSEQIKGIQQGLQSVVTGIGQQLNKTASNLSESIGKVGKPEPPENAKLEFGFFPEHPEQFPVKTLTFEARQQWGIYV